MKTIHSKIFLCLVIAALTMGFVQTEPANAQEAPQTWTYEVEGWGDGETEALALINAYYWFGYAMAQAYADVNMRDDLEWVGIVEGSLKQDNIGSTTYVYHAQIEIKWIGPGVYPGQQPIAGLIKGNWSSQGILEHLDFDDASVVF